MIELTLPYPPTLNNAFVSRGRFRVLSPKARAYKEEVAKLAQIARIKPLEGNVGIILWVYRPRKVGDLDNTLKLLLDGLKGYAWIDDKQIIQIQAYRFDDKENPRAVIQVHALP